MRRNVLVLLFSGVAALNVKWFAPFYSGGGYCSEAIDYLAILSRVSWLELGIEQHGDGFSSTFAHGLSQETQTLLKSSLLTGRRMKSIDIAICHSEPGAWDPPLYQTSKCPPDNAKIRIGRTMFETDRTPKGWVERLNKMDEIWVPTKQVFWSCK